MTPAELRVQADQLEVDYALTGVGDPAEPARLRAQADQIEQQAAPPPAPVPVLPPLHSVHIPVAAAPLPPSYYIQPSWARRDGNAWLLVGALLGIPGFVLGVWWVVFG